MTRVSGSKVAAGPEAGKDSSCRKGSVSGTKKAQMRGRGDPVGGSSRGDELGDGARGPPCGLRRGGSVSHRPLEPKRRGWILSCVGEDLGNALLGDDGAGRPLRKASGRPTRKPAVWPGVGAVGRGGGARGLLKKLTTKWPRRRQPSSCPDAPRTESGVSRRCAPRAPRRLAERGTCPRAHRGVAGTAGRHPAVKGGRSDTRPNAPAAPWGPCAD